MLIDPEAALLKTLTGRPIDLLDKERIPSLLGQKKT
jgi:hypothetical protein